MNTSNLDAKIARIRIIHANLLELDGMFGRDVPSSFPWAMPFVRMIKTNEPWHARFIPDSFICMARKSRAMVGESILAAPGWTAIEVYIRGVCKLAYNIRGEDIVPHRHEPSLWETWFGADNAGDTIPYLPDLFADDKDPRWRAFKASGLSEWPPRLDRDDKDPKAPPAA
jgi:hypothetical protein